MSNAEQIINLVPTLDENTCQLVLAFINDLQGKSTGEQNEKLDISMINQIDSLTQQVQSIGEVSDCTVEELAASYLEDKYNL